MKRRQEIAVEVSIAELKGLVERVDAKVDASNNHQALAVEASQRHGEQLVTILKGSLDRVNDRVQGIELDLTTHVEAVNPHPNQEQWVRTHLASLGTEITALSSEMSAWRGSLKTWGLVGATVVGVVASVVSGLILTVLH